MEIMHIFQMYMGWDINGLDKDRGGLVSGRGSMAALEKLETKKGGL